MLPILINFLKFDLAIKVVLVHKYEREFDGTQHEK